MSEIIVPKDLNKSKKCPRNKCTYLFFYEFVKICGEQVIKRKNEQRRKKKTKVFLKNNFIPFWIDFRLVHGLYKRGVINPFLFLVEKSKFVK